MFISYAKNFEDVMLWRALKHIPNGFYIDIGAQDSVVNSVSRGFYEKGWRGVHVEPTTTYVEKLRENRPDEVVMQAAVGKSCEEITFYEVPETGLSTSDPKIAEMHKQSNFKVIETTVTLLPLSELLNQHLGNDIHWLKIHVEGMEQSVIESWLPSDIRPWIVVVENTGPLKQDEVFQDWEPFIQCLGYLFVYFDGLNRFYVSSEHSELKVFFSVAPNIFDYFSISGSANSPVPLLLNKKIQELERSKDDVTIKYHHEGKRALFYENEIKTYKKQLAEVNDRLAEINNELLVTMNSISWKITSPIRFLRRSVKWLIQGTLVWVTFKPGCRPHRILRQLIVKFIGYGKNHPWFFQCCKRFLKYMPSIELRLMRRAVADQSLLSIYPKSVGELSAPALEIYEHLLSIREYSLNLKNNKSQLQEMAASANCTNAFCSEGVSAQRKI